MKMTLKEFGRLVRQVMQTLPQEFYRHIGNIVVDVEEMPDPEMMRRNGFSEQEIAEGGPVLGHFAPLNSSPDIWPEDQNDEPPDEFHHDSLDQPNRLIIYKRPHETSFPDRNEFLLEVRKTVIHELAHHFGYSERDLERFDADPDPFGKRGGEEAEP